MLPTADLAPCWHAEKKQKKDQKEEAERAQRLQQELDECKAAHFTWQVRLWPAVPPGQPAGQQQLGPSPDGKGGLCGALGSSWRLGPTLVPCWAGMRGCKIVLLTVGTRMPARLACSVGGLVWLHAVIRIPN